MTVSSAPLSELEGRLGLEPRDAPWFRALLKVARASGEVANFCDHLEHCEDADRLVISDAAQTLRAEALRLAGESGVDLFGAYADRLEMVERRSPLYPLPGFDARAAVDAADSWIDLQRVQASHDRLYHLDVVGLHKQEQLRHCALHLAKLVSALAESLGDRRSQEDFCRTRLPDMIIFALKLATLVGVPLEGGRRES